MKKEAGIREKAVRLVLIISLLFVLGCVNDIPKEGIVSYKSSDGLEVYGILSKPAGNGPFPAVILVHGGTPTGNLNASRWGKYVERLLEEGYVTFALDYRGSSGYSEEYKTKAELGGKEIGDVVYGFNYLKDLPYVDYTSIGIIGESHGGYMALMAAPKLNFKAIVDFYGFTEAGSFFSYVEESINNKGYHDDPEKAELLANYKAKLGSPKYNPEPYAALSPINYVNEINASILIIHGAKDESVLVEQSYKLKAALAKAGKEFELVIYEDAGHEFIFNNSLDAQDALENVVEFLNRNLKP